METSREFARPQATDRDTRSALRDLLIALQMMGPDTDRLIDDFAYCAGIIAGADDAPAQLRAMMKFATAYHQFGFDMAKEAINSDSGIPVDVLIREQSIEEGLIENRTRAVPGTILGLVGARNRHPRERVYDGVAVIEDELERERFVVVGIERNGDICFHPDQLDRFSPGPNKPYTLISERAVEDIYPPSG